ncbi:MAG: acetylxylan esterase, partial [Muribaculaceae bacterium]|nr:acetylxylan esterase [Muribaculaceae bacterium]
FSLAFLLGVRGVAAQPAERLYKLSVYPENGEWRYQPGQKVKFSVNLLRCDVPEGDVELSYDITEDMMNPHKTGKVKLKNGRGTIDAGTMKQPGFLRCRVYMKKDGRNYEGMGTVGYAPDKLIPVTQRPTDFGEFWTKAIADARKWSLDPIMTLMPERCTSKVKVYHVSWGNNDWNSRMYGILSVPAAEGSYPAILKLPGAGVRGYNGDTGHAEKGFIVLEIGIHGIPVNLPAEVYTGLYNGALKRYHSFNMDDRDRFYYKRVITGCVRGIDFLEQLPEYNGCLATFGGSQGGGLSIIVAGLDKRVKGLVSYYPAMSDMAGYSAGRAGGWPHTLKDTR